MNIDTDTDTGHEQGHSNLASHSQAIFEIGFWSLNRVCQTMPTRLDQTDQNVVKVSKHVFMLLS
jgi:hypothetical protein